MPITSTQRRTLRASAHALDPVVLIGNHGLSPAVFDEIDRSLRSHELIKIHVAGEDREVRQRILREICAAVRAEAVQSIGRMLVIYRENTDVAPRRAPARRKPARALKRSFQVKP